MINGLSLMLEEIFKGCADVTVKTHTFGEARASHKVTMVYCEVLVNIRDINQYVLPALAFMAKTRKPLMASEFEDANLLNMTQLRVQSPSEVIDTVFDGKLLLRLNSDHELFMLDIANPPNRQPEESSMEVTVKGAKDAFTEDLRTNVGLIRKRLRTNSLSYEEYKIGNRSPTKIGLLFLNDLAQPEIIEEARKRLQKIDAEVPTLSMIEEVMSDRKFSLFPLVDSTQRPELAVGCLLNSRFVILMEGMPLAIIAPISLTELIKSAEDAYFPFFIVTCQRAIRIAGILIALFLPGFWIAITSYHPEQLPMLFLATVAMGRYGIPYSNTFETFLMQFMFELFREAGLRLPKAVGQTVAVVGGLMVGDAAIRAGLTSPSMLVVTAVSAVASFTLINPSLTNAVTIVKFLVMILASTFGLFGFFLSAFGLCIYLTSLESFGVPYLTPLAPLNVRELISAILSKSSTFDDDKPSLITKSKRRGRRGRNK
ncbi:spore germination protein [Alicyclobacillus fodiniaquatilis]|uniref:Spore germination protein n=1 Tax=Alicyclobacillus fodiniaquatilis TaxID=1661150 RepID=A0ABW4JJQ8_9BACL